MYGETSVHVVNHLKQVLTALDTLVTEKKDKEAKGIRYQLLAPNSIMMLLLLAEILVPINNFCGLL